MCSTEFSEDWHRPAMFIFKDEMGSKHKMLAAIYCLIEKNIVKSPRDKWFILNSECSSTFLTEEEQRHCFSNTLPITFKYFRIWFIIVSFKRRVSSLFRASSHSNSERHLHRETLVCISTRFSCYIFLYRSLLICCISEFNYEVWKHPATISARKVILSVSHVPMKRLWTCLHLQRCCGAVALL